MPFHRSEGDPRRTFRFAEKQPFRMAHTEHRFYLKASAS